MRSRSMVIGVLIVASLISLCVDAVVEANTLPSTIAVPTNILINATAIDYSPSAVASRIITDTALVADLAILSTQPTLIPDGTIVYTLTIRNQGPSPATDVVLTNVLPKGITPVSTQPAQPGCERHERSVRCALGDVHSTDTTSITLDLSIGGTQTQTTNTPLAGVTLDLSAPNCSIDSSQSSITCRLTKLPASADAQIRIGVNLDAQITNTLINSATVIANETDPNPANNRTTITMTVGGAMSVTVAPIPMTTDLVMQADGPSRVIAGQPFTYTYTISNRGELDATDVHFEDALPSTANFYSVSPGLPQCDQRGNDVTCSFHDPDSGETITFTLTITGNAGQPVRIIPDPIMPGLPICTVLKERTWLHIVNCELGTLKRGKTTQVRLGLVAIGMQEQMMTNTASVHARETDVNPRDNAITSTMVVSVRSDLQIRSAISGPAIAGKPLSYTLTVSNNGPSDADGIVLTDTLPMNTRLVSTILSQGDECRLEGKDAATNVVVCRLKPMSGDNTASVTIILAVDEPVAKSIVHSAKVTSDQVDPDLSNNELTESIPVRAAKD